jgi:polyhydroxybutyrate depolymerase
MERRTIEIGGRERAYRLARAPDTDKPPLLMVLHGLGMPPCVMPKWTRLALRGPEAGFATVFPEGVARMWDDTGLGRSDGVDDDAFMTTLVSSLAEDGIADARALVLVGVSNGGFFAERLARAAILAPRALVLVASTVRESSRQTVRHPRNATAVLCFAGTADRVVPYVGGRASGPFARLRRRRVRRRLVDPMNREVAGAQTLAEEWASVNGIEGPPTVAAVPATELPVTRLTWSAPGRPPVVLYRIEGGAHGWPGGPQYLPRALVGRIPQDLDATGILLAFARDALAATTA